MRMSGYKEKKPMKLARDTFLAIGLACSTLAAAAEFDGSVPLTCTPTAGQNCTPTGGCSKLKPESPPPKGGLKVLIDFANKSVKTPYRTDLLPIQNSATNDEQLILQGTNLKFAWSAVVLRKDGSITITVADRVGAYVIFGKCTTDAG